MSDPAKDYKIRKKRKSRKTNEEMYKPIVLWVKPGTLMVDETPVGVHDSTESIRQVIVQDLESHNFIDVCSSDPPRVTNIETEFDNE